MTPDTRPMALLDANLDFILFELYTEDPAYIGLSDLEVIAWPLWIPNGPNGGLRADPPVAPGANTVFSDTMIIEILVACENPFELIATTQVDPATYFYDGELTWTVNPF